MRQLIKVDGTIVNYATPLSFSEMKNAMRCDCAELVLIGRAVAGHTMLVDEDGYNKGLPYNVEATKLYHLNCRPGTTHRIVGDVFVCPDREVS
jgi:hypothetical protein